MKKPLCITLKWSTVSGNIDVSGQSDPVVQEVGVCLLVIIKEGKSVWRRIAESLLLKSPPKILME